MRLLARNRTWTPTSAKSCDLRFTTRRWHRRQDSNLHKTRFRRPALHPLSHDGMASTTGLEPATFRSTGGCSNQLSYVPMVGVQRIELCSHD